MDALIGNLAHPSDKVRFQRRPRGEPVAGDRILLDVAAVWRSVTVKKYVALGIRAQR